MSMQPPNPPAAAPCLASFAALADIDPYTLSATDQVELVVELERHGAWFESVRLRAIAAAAGAGDEFGEPVPGEPETITDTYYVEDAIQDELAAATRMSGIATSKRIAVARDLEYKLPTTRALLAAGVCSYQQAVVVSDECERLTIAQARDVEARALTRAHLQTPAQTRRSVRRAVAAIAPTEPEAVINAEFARRDVAMCHDGGVMATITATLPAPDAIAVWNALTACAQASANQHPNDARTMAHKRADALTAWAHQAFNDPDLPVMQGKKRLETQVVIDVATLFGLAENPGEIIGYGPIPADLARQLAADSQCWRRLVTDGVTGHLLDYGPRTYQPPARLREYILARDRHCQFPGCNRPAQQCDIDHVEPFTGTDQGGNTSADNLITLCRRHHRLKTHTRWRIHIDKPTNGPPTETIIRWTSPRSVSHHSPRPNPLDHLPDKPLSAIEGKLSRYLLAS